MKLTSSKRVAVRTALVTGTTLATIIGAQALASLDEASFSKIPPAMIAPADLDTQSTGDLSGASVALQAPAAAPNIVILRHAGQAPLLSDPTPHASTSTANASSVAVQPPNPVQVIAPQPVLQPAPVPQIVTAPQPAAQQSAPPVARTRSSR